MEARPQITPHQEQESLQILRYAGIKLELPIQIIQDAVIFLRQTTIEKSAGNVSYSLNYHLNDNQLCFAIDAFPQNVLICACLYLSCKINEHEKARIRDMINVVIY